MRKDAPKPQPVGEVVKLSILTLEKLNQAAFFIATHSGWSNNTGSDLLKDMTEAREQFDKAAGELGENPHKIGSNEWHFWNDKHYLSPIRKKLAEARKKKYPLLNKKKPPIIKLPI